jgi:spore coat protein U-like protein
MFKSIHLSRNLGLLVMSTAAAVPLVFMTAPLQAATATTTFQVTATVVAGCTVSANNIIFGNYDSQAAAALNANATITLNCTSGVPFTVALDAGQHAGGASNFSARAMSDGTSTDPLLGYQIYTDSGHTIIWGDGTNSSQTVGGTGTGPGTANAIIETMYGQIPAGQTVVVGSYNDNPVTVTVTY